MARVPFETGLPGTLPLDHASPTGAQSCPVPPWRLPVLTPAPIPAPCFLLESVSINRLAGAAGISRGSFYQYFSDKPDMLEAVLTGYRRQGTSYVMERLEQTGDLFGLFEDMMDFAVAFAGNEENRRICRNVLASPRVNNLPYLRYPWSGEGQEFREELLARIQTKDLDVRGTEELAELAGILLAVCREAIGEVFADGEHRERVRSRYRKQLRLLKRGFTRGLTIRERDGRCHAGTEEHS